LQRHHNRDLAPEEVASPGAQLWNRAFTTVLLSVFFAYGANALVTAIIPLRVVDLGGSNVLAGAVLATSSVLAFFLRPIAGHLADRWQPKGVLLVGGMFFAVGNALWLMPSLIVAFPAQIAQGLGWSGVAPGGQTLVARLAPTRRRGEASGFYFLSTQMGQAFLPALALWLLDTTNYSIVFLMAGTMAVMSAVSTSTMASGPKPLLVSAQTKPAGFISGAALLPSAVIFLLMVTSPGTLGFLPLYAREEGIDNIAVAFLASGILALVAQPALSRFSDRLGRVPVISGGLVFTALGLAALGVGGSLILVVISLIVYRVGTAAVLPALMAMVMDRSETSSQGAAQATFAAFVQLGIMVGSLLGGVVSDWAGYSFLYFIAIFPILVALALLGWIHRKQPVA
jgi:MFS family permease